MHNKIVSSSNLTYSGFTETPVEMIVEQKTEF